MLQGQIFVKMKGWYNPKKQEHIKKKPNRQSHIERYTFFKSFFRVFNHSTATSPNCVPNFATQLAHQRKNHLIWIFYNSVFGQHKE